MNINDKYIRGYLVCSKDKSIASLSDWKSWEIGIDYKLLCHPKTEVFVKNGCDQFIAVIGRIYDCDNPTDSIANICEKIFQLSKSSNPESLVRYVSYLSGRFSIILRKKNGFLAIPDCAATYSLHYAVVGNGLYLASHWALAAEASGAKQNDDVLQFMRSSKYQEPGGKYYPGLWTPFENVKTLMANHVLKFQSPEQGARQSRFYPFQDIENRVGCEVYCDFEQRLIANCTLCLGKENAFSLTGGGDSRATLSAYVANPPRKPLHAFTYIKPHSPTPEQFEDVFTANRIAWISGLHHLVIPVYPVDFACNFHKWYSASFPLGARYPSLARTYYENIPLDSTIIISTLAEVGTNFYKKRTEANPSPSALASKFTTSEIKSDPRLLMFMEEYMDETQFDIDRMFGLNWHDLFYWEHRNSKWASLWYAEVDMTGFAIIPYNDRKLLELMLSLSHTEREEKYLQKRISRTWLSPLGA